MQKRSRNNWPSNCAIREGEGYWNAPSPTPQAERKKRVDASILRRKGIFPLCVFLRAARLIAPKGESGKRTRGFVRSMLNLRDERIQNVCTGKMLEMRKIFEKTLERDSQKKLFRILQFLTLYSEPRCLTTKFTYASTNFQLS